MDGLGDSLVLRLERLHSGGFVLLFAAIEGGVRARSASGADASIRHCLDVALHGRFSVVLLEVQHAGSRG